MKNSLATTRRNVIIGACLVWALVIAGLGFASVTTIQLESERIHQEERESHDDTVALAMYRLDSIDAQVREHQNHPIDIFKPEYQPARARDPKTGEDLPDEAIPILPSPLLKDWPTWVLFHFQTGPNHWVSPQLSKTEQADEPIGEIFHGNEGKQRLAREWYAALRLYYNADKLRAALDDALSAADRRAGIDDSTSIEPKPFVKAQNTKQHLSRSLNEFERRDQRLVRNEEPAPTRCECRNNILTQSAYPNANRHHEYESDICLEYFSTLTEPVWLTLDDQMQLALMRYVKTENDNIWAIQGVLFDWTQLRALLEKEVADLLPGASIEPVELDAPPSSTLLNTIPARLVADFPDIPATAAIWSRIGWGLSITWIITLLALAATIYGALKYFNLVERRMRFTSAVTHELRTPLTSFQLYTDLLGDLEDHESDQRRTYVKVLKNESRRLSKLVENVFAYSRVADSGAKLSLRPVKPSTILSDLSQHTERHRTNGAVRKLLIDNQLPESTEITTDPEYVDQILTNLVENACKYGGSDDIWVTARPGPDNGCVIEVDDGGNGIDPSDLKTIFEPFRRGKDACAQQTGGMGLGLALSRFWADCLNGKLSVKRSSRNGGHYSCFALELPGKPKSV